MLLWTKLLHCFCILPLSIYAYEIIINLKYLLIFYSLAIQKGRLHQMQDITCLAFFQHTQIWRYLLILMEFCFAYAYQAVYILVLIMDIMSDGGNRGGGFLSFSTSYEFTLQISSGNTSSLVLIIAKAQYFDCNISQLFNGFNWHHWLIYLLKR